MCSIDVCTWKWTWKYIFLIFSKTSHPIQRVAFYVFWFVFLYKKMCFQVALLTSWLSETKHFRSHASINFITSEEMTIWITLDRLFLHLNFFIIPWNFLGSIYKKLKYGAVLLLYTTVMSSFKVENTSISNWHYKNNARAV